MGLCNGNCSAGFSVSVIIHRDTKAWGQRHPPGVAYSRVLWDVMMKLRLGTQVPLFLTCHKLFVSGLDGSGFAPCIPFHMIESVSVHEYDNVSYFLSHTIWKCQFRWWRALISPRQANENTGQWDFSVTALRNSWEMSLTIKYEILL